MSNRVHAGVGASAAGSGQGRSCRDCRARTGSAARTRAQQFSARSRRPESGAPQRMTPIESDLATGGEGGKGSNDWLASSRAALARVQFAPQAETVGRVEHVSDGIASVSGLPDVRLNEMLRFEGGRFGFALTLDADAIGAVLLDDGDAISAGSRVTGTGRVVEVPVGPGLLGRGVEPLGRPLDNNEPVSAEMHLPIERPAPSILDRGRVAHPVGTGIL